MTSIIRDPAHEKDIKDISATPLLLSLEDASVADFSKAFKGCDVVYFSAGAGGKGSEERTKKVDYEGALKIFDAIEGVEGPVKPRLILVSALDIRDPEKIPAHYVSTYSFHMTILVKNLLISPFLLGNHRAKMISCILIGYGKPFQHTCTGSTKPTRILRNVHHSTGPSYVLGDCQIIQARGGLRLVEHI